MIPQPFDGVTGEPARLAASGAAQRALDDAQADLRAFALGSLEQLTSELAPQARTVQQRLARAIEELDAARAAYSGPLRRWGELADVSGREDLRASLPENRSLQ